ncbi:PP2C family protein-serine/threonine phosphatase [Allostreptomyces psammosilenae]|uniref:PP2C family protein-serine/threonine phosphatase n=1 Tax=Allostreptomyces psammosilenae TaxID=1892865 RepID=UPI001FE2ABB2|nr:SpoIIE family protein phosphatase [Allostreptomyces psammosilenae]
MPPPGPAARTAVPGTAAPSGPVPGPVTGPGSAPTPGGTPRATDAAQPNLVPHQRSGDDTRMVVLLVEDDAADALLVEELLTEGDVEFDVRWVRTLADATGQLATGVDCVLLDLGLPDTAGFEGLRHLLRLDPHVAVLVLTGLADAHRGAEAVRHGAQDYLVKHEVDASLLTRAIRYAVERKRADESQRRLVESELRAQENARLERGLLPTPLLDGSDLAFQARYRPGRSRTLLGGDFYDAVRTDDGTVHVVIGDVCGHGPDEAALGVCLRIAWRTLIFTGSQGGELLATLERILEHERSGDEVFVTLCTLAIRPDGRSALVHSAGHPSPLLLGVDGGPADLLPADAGGPALGLLPGGDWPGVEVPLGASWRLMLFTDGLIEGRTGPGSSYRLGQEGLVELLREPEFGALAPIEGPPDAGAIDRLIARVERINDGPLTDDVAVLLLGRDGDGSRIGP